jgi:DnaJ-class molecular chaperone
MKTTEIDYVEATYKDDHFFITAYFVDAEPFTKKIKAERVEEIILQTKDITDAFHHAWLGSGSNEVNCKECNGDGEYFIDEIIGCDGVIQRYHDCEECDGEGVLEVQG